MSRELVHKGQDLFHGPNQNHVQLLNQKKERTTGPPNVHNQDGGMRRIREKSGPKSAGHRIS